MKFQTVLILCAFASGCSSGGSSDDPAPLDDEQPNRFDATYDLNAISTTPYETGGGECGDATGSMIIVNSEITGSALSSGGYMYSINGNVTSNGQVNGGFAVSGENVAIFDGVITGSTGSGRWNENFGCSGTWEILQVDN